MHKEEFITEVEKLGINITDEIMEKLDKYYKILVEYNKHTNLTRIIEEDEVYLKHFYDSLTIVKAINLNDQTLLDIGTGAGFPGLVLKIVFPNLKVTLVDSLNKRVTFLNNIIDELQLTNITAVHARAEDYIENHREVYDIVTSRAVANLSILSELSIPYVKVNGYFIPMKADAELEIKQAKKAVETLGSVLKDIIIFKLPKEESVRMLPKIQKVTQTNKKYPRKFSEIKKKTL